MKTEDQYRDLGNKVANTVRQYREEPISDWKQVKKSNDVIVWCRPSSHANSSGHLYKGEATVNASLEDIFKFVGPWEESRRAQWDKTIKLVEVVERPAEEANCSKYYYCECKGQGVDIVLHPYIKQPSVKYGWPLNKLWVTSSDVRCAFCTSWLRPWDLVVMRSVTHSYAMGSISPRDFIDLVLITKTADEIFTSGISIEHTAFPPSSDIVRGTNAPLGLSIAKIPGEPNKCKVVNFIHTDLCGKLPKAVLQQVFPSNIVDFFVQLRHAIKKGIQHYHEKSVKAKEKSEKSEGKFSKS